MTRHQIDVALTFASEQQKYVQRVARDLSQSGVITFFQPYEKVKLWGEDLIPYLDRVFREWATLCVMFISKEYVKKAWPSHERQSALARQLEQQSLYILPVRFDDTPVPGLSTTIQYLRAKEFTESQLAESIRQKLKKAKSTT